jgi:hypothetical protein
MLDKEKKHQGSAHETVQIVPFLRLSAANQWPFYRTRTRGLWDILDNILCIGMVQLLNT